jgi:hypothetical protein
LMTAAMTTTFRCCPSRIPTSAFRKRDVSIRHEFDLWTRKFRPVVEYAVSRMDIGM